MNWHRLQVRATIPGMQTYQQYCPVARALEVLADRWTLLIVRELLLGSHRFNDIERGLPGISRSLLASRLRDLQHAGIIERLPSLRSRVEEYHFSDAGHELKPVIEALGGWGVRWAFDDPKPEELDAGLLVWKIHQRIDRDRLPDQRLVVEFDFTGGGGRRVWLVLDPREVSVCVTPPRFEADLIVRADLSLFYRVWLGRLDYATAMRSGQIVVEGPPTLARQLPRWFLWSPMAPVVRSATTDRRDASLCRRASRPARA